MSSVSDKLLFLRGNAPWKQPLGVGASVVHVLGNALKEEKVRCVKPTIIVSTLLSHLLKGFVNWIVILTSTGHSAPISYTHKETKSKEN